MSFERFHFGAPTLSVVNALTDLWSKGKAQGSYLIASRRQVESDTAGIGYNNQFNASDLMAHIKSRTDGKYFVARDHGGPFQGLCETEGKMSRADAMVSAAKALKSDISCGFSMLHLDPSTISSDRHHGSVQEYLDDTCRLYETVHESVKENGILIEVGSDEGVLGQLSLEDQFRFHDELDAKFQCEGWCLPSNRVIDIGTHVFELDNEGNDFVDGELCEFVEQLNRLNGKNFTVKIHNCDYLRPNKLDILLKIHNSQFNISPELAAVENEFIFKNLNNNEFISVCIEEIAKRPLFKKWVRGKIDQLSIFKLGFHYIESNFLSGNEWYAGWCIEHGPQRVEMVKHKMEAFYALG